MLSEKLIILTKREASITVGQIDLDHWMAPLPYCEREIRRRRHHRRCPHQNHAVRARRLLMATLQRIRWDRLAEHHRVRLHNPPAAVAVSLGFSTTLCSHSLNCTCRTHKRNATEVTKI